MQITVDQTRAIEAGEAVQVVVNQTECVILRKDVSDRVPRLIYDDGDLTQSEMLDRVISQLPDSLMEQMDDCMKISLGIS